VPEKSECKLKTNVVAHGAVEKICSNCVLTKVYEREAYRGRGNAKPQIPTDVPTLRLGRLFQHRATSTEM
jgi:hypothetical protein